MDKLSSKSIPEVKHSAVAGLPNVMK